MPQDAESGATANDFGHETASAIASKIGAVSVSDTSNEFAYRGRLITIRCAHQNTIYVGVIYSMLDRVDTIIGAFENQGGAYELFEMTPALYRLHMRDSKNEGKVGLVRRSTFQELGKRIETLWIT